MSPNENKMNHAAERAAWGETVLFIRNTNIRRAAVRSSAWLGVAFRWLAAISEGGVPPQRSAPSTNWHLRCKRIASTPKPATSAIQNSTFPFVQVDWLDRIAREI